MEQSIIMILAIITVVSFIVMLITYLLLFSKKKGTELTRLISIAIIFLVYGVLYDNLRVLIFQLGVVSIEYIDQLCYFLEILLYFFSLSAVFKAIAIFNRQSGHLIKGERFFRFFFLGLAAVASAANVYLFQTAPYGTSGFITYQLHTYINYAILFVYIPFFIYLILRTSTFYKEVRDKSLRFQVLLSLIFFGLLLLNRYWNNSLYSIFPSSNGLLLVDQVTLILIAIGGLLLFMNNPDLLDNVSTYFCVQGVYLIKKDGGYVLYGYDFQNLARNEVISQDQMLLGGVYSSSNYRVKGDTQS